MQMHNSPILRSDPETAVTIAERSFGLGLAHTRELRVRFYLSINESLDSAIPSEERCAIEVFTQSPDSIRHSRKRIKRSRTRLPTPQSAVSSNPEIALAVLKQVHNGASQRSEESR